MIFIKGLPRKRFLSKYVQLIISVIFLVALWHFVTLAQLQGTTLLHQQSQQLARILTEQIALAAAPAIKINDKKQLQWLTAAFVKNPKVVSVSFFNSDGILLAHSSSVDPNGQLNEAELKQTLDFYSPFVEPIYQDDIDLGYVRVRVIEGEFINVLQSSFRLFIEEQWFMMFIAGLSGFLLAQSLNINRKKS